MMKSKKIAYLSVMTCIALVIFAVEAQIPPLVPIPGIKLGLANIITLITLVYFGKREALAVLFVRIVLASLFAGTVTGFLYSIAGGLLSFLVMCLMLKISGKEKLWAVSAFAAMAHNTGQICVAAIITQTVQIFWYLPFLIISGIITGVFTGLCAGLVLKYLK
ncbi:MAG: Gx transporter family protein [Clostridia bacterium]|nr:Gx transporter family protein [Clostridia bacterium]